MQLDAFMKIEEPKLEGESTDSVHAKEIEILSFEQTITRGQQGVNAPSGDSKAKAEHEPFRIIKPLDRTSPKLSQAASAGTLYKKVTISVCQPSGTAKTTNTSWKKTVYLEIVLQQVHICRLHLVADPRVHFFGRANTFPLVAGDFLAMGPLEELDLTYKKIQWLYKGGSGTLNISGKWDLQTNKAE